MTGLAGFFFASAAFSFAGRGRPFTHAIYASGKIFKRSQANEVKATDTNNTLQVPIGDSKFATTKAAIAEAKKTQIG